MAQPRHITGATLPTHQNAIPPFLPFLQEYDHLPIYEAAHHTGGVISFGTPIGPMMGSSTPAAGYAYQSFEAP